MVFSVVYRWQGPIALENDMIDSAFYRYFPGCEEKIDWLETIHGGENRSASRVVIWQTAEFPYLDWFALEAKKPKVPTPCCP